MDQTCLDLKHCSECLEMDGCDPEQDFAPEMTEDDFSCDHLQGDSCKESTQIVSRFLFKI
jgi:hypothetical protein